jgi:Uma2 family endonuclease
LVVEQRVTVFPGDFRNFAIERAELACCIDAERTMIIIVGRRILETIMSTVSQRAHKDVSQWRYTAADLAALPSDLPSGSVRFELDNGRLVTLPSPRAAQHALQLRIAAALFQTGDRQGHGRTRCGDVRIILWQDPDRVVAASVAFISQRLLPPQENSDGYLQTIPDLVVEVVGENETDDYVERKVSDLLAAGVGQVWTADPRTKTITVHSASAPPRPIHEGQTLRFDDPIPGFELKPAEIFSD